MTGIDRSISHRFTINGAVAGDFITSTPDNLDRMKEIQKVATVPATPDEVKKELSPASIIEYTGTYTIEYWEKRDERLLLGVTTENIEMVLEFTELENGYRYRQNGEKGPFEKMSTSITVDGDEIARVTIESKYTFGGVFSPVKDWLVAGLQSDELERILINISTNVEDE